MRLIDLYYKAFIEYRKNTIENPEAVKARRVIKHANIKDEKLETIKYSCEIEEDWIAEIEEGLIFVEKAIFEERQFIKSEGEIVNIEKVKKTSKDTVEHLSRNSNFITRVPKPGDTLIPDKLYIVEKLSDYAVYENRFLYLVLTYLKDFLHTRLDKIRKKVTTYEAKMNLNKDIKFNNRLTNFHLQFEDTYSNDPFLTKSYYNIPLVDRLEQIYYSTEALLKTQLMIQVSKAAMLRPPIVKTNVLRMNPNFRGASALYDFVTSYSKDGYTFKEEKVVTSPLLADMSDEIADVIDLSTFLVYQYGNNITADLKEKYEEFLKVEEKKEALKKAEELTRLEKRVRELNVDHKEYILLLEKRNRELEKNNLEYENLKTVNDENIIKMEELKEINEDLTSKYDETLELHNELNLEVLDLKNKHINYIVQADEMYANRINALVLEQEEEIARLNAELQENLSQVIYEHEEKTRELKNELDERLNNLRQVQNEELSSLNDEMNSINNEFKEFKEEHKQIIKDYETKLEISDQNKNTILGELYSLKQRKGVVSVDEIHTSREKFKELEAVKKAFDNFFNEQWRLTKAQIRKDVKENSKNKLEEKNNKQ